MVYAGRAMVKQTTQPHRAAEARHDEPDDLAALREEVDALVEIARNGLLKHNGRANRDALLGAVVAHWAPALRELEKH